MDEAHTGLTTNDAKKLHGQYGYNELNHQQERIGWIKILLRQFTSPFVYVIFLAAAVTAVYLRDFVDSAVMLLAVFVNTILGFIQEYKAEKSLGALKNLLTPTAKVIRDGKRSIIPASELVPGDLVILEIGNTIPADGTVVEADSLAINEAILTGESMPVEKAAFSKPFDISHLAFGIPPASQVAMGTTVASGIGKFVVTAIGPKTRMGKIAGTLSRTRSQKTPLQQRIATLSRTLTIFIVVVALAIAAIGIATGKNPVEMFELGTAIAIASLPEGLPITLTILLSLGMQRIHKRKALVRELAAAETLGSVTTICTDKTGTLTEGKMRVIEAITSDEATAEGGALSIQQAAVLCNDLRDPLEIAMDEWFRRTFEDSSAGGQARDVLKQFPRIDEIPFSPATKLIATLHEVSNKQQLTSESHAFPSRHSLAASRLLLVSGAPEVLLEKTTLSHGEKQEWYKKFEQIGYEGLRLVAFAYKEYKATSQSLRPTDMDQLAWLGVLTFEDPIREGVADALKEAQKLGLKVHVVTGDHRATTEAVIRKLGVDHVTIHARVTPEEKLKIVTDLQSSGEVVAMTGDGVNDAPALKKANIGIVVSSASDVSKETADMVLLDNNFQTIVAAIKEGRSIHERLRTIITFLLSDSFAEVVLIGLALLFGFPAPILAVQLLWVNIISDGLPGMALTTEPSRAARELIPTALSASLVPMSAKWVIMTASTVTGLAAFITFAIVISSTGNLPLARTVVFAILGTSTLFSVFSIRSLTTPIWKVKQLVNPWLVASVTVGWVLQLVPIYLRPVAQAFGTTPLSVAHWTVILVIGLATVISIELVKLRTRGNQA